jgi:2-oxoglutarate dehydrogenase E2 component (dihydrolipoamide succinyltransferase)
MAQVELIMPKMGESIMEATILNWVKKVGDTVEMDETILEIATDKVDSEIPSPVDGVLSEIKFEENETVEIGKVIAIISTEGEEPVSKPSPAVDSAPSSNNGSEPAQSQEPQKESPEPVPATGPATPEPVAEARPSATKRFYSPLVRNIAKQEGISIEELEKVNGTGKDGRVTKHDMLAYLDSRAEPKSAPATTKPESKAEPTSQIRETPATPTPQVSGNVEIIEMDRMRKLIADHMVRSKHTSPHVTSFVEVDVTDIVEWRNKNKTAFQTKYGDKITFTPIFMEAVVKAIKDYPMINMSVDGDRLLVKKDINIGMAAALPNGNLIVPVIRGADNLNLAGLARSVNDLAGRARENKLKPEEIQGGTFTLTNVGTFGNVMGTPIINQPQVAILATGAIRKKPAVVETEYGDLIAIRHMMFLSLSYDHRVVDGFLGGSFLRRVGDYLEAFDKERDY